MKALRYVRNVGKFPPNYTIPNSRRVYTLHSYRLQNVNYNGYTTTDIPNESTASILQGETTEAVKAEDGGGLFTLIR